MGAIHKVTNALNISDEILSNIPTISLIGKNEFSIENYKGIVLYSENKIKINTNIGIVAILGYDLTLSKVLSEKIVITGQIDEINYTEV